MIFFIISGENKTIIDEDFCAGEGKFYVSLELNGQFYNLLCDNGRILVQKMTEASEYFDKLQEDYELGLDDSVTSDDASGDLVTKNYMINLNVLHILTTTYGYNTLYVSMSDGSINAKYEDFVIGDEVIQCSKISAVH